MDQLVLKARTWSKSEKNLLYFSGAILFALLTVLSAVRIPLPFTPVPMTLQTFVVPLAGGFLGAAWGFASMLLYLFLGLFGFASFAAASNGLAFFASPTAGYLLAYPLVAFLIGRAQRYSN